MLREHLTLFQGCTLNELVSTSIEQEDACRGHIGEEQKKRPLSGPTGALSRSTVWSTLLCQASHMVPLYLSRGITITVAGDPTPSSLPTASYSTSSSTTCWGGLLVIQLRANGALCSRVSLASIGLLS
jgi:hypothetical protein